VDFYLTVDTNKTGLYIANSGTGWVTACNFYGLKATGLSGPTAGSKGVDIENAGGVLGGFSFFSPIVQNQAIAFSYNTTGTRGDMIVNPYFEGNTSNIISGPNVVGLLISGGQTSDGTPLVSSVTGSQTMYTVIDQSRGNLITNGTASLGSTYVHGTLQSSSTATFGGGNPGGISISGLGPMLGFYTTDSNASARNWAIVTDWDTAGDFDIKLSGAKGGDPGATGTTKLQIKNDGTVTLGTYTGHTTNIVCFKDGGTLGYCSSAANVVSNGTCTCN
jgi:hypothetical protein